MDNTRSPRYPAMSLENAITGARSLWVKEKRTPVNGEVLAKALGYGSLSGPARTKIASMRQYGLLEQFGGGLRLSDVGMVVVHHYGDDSDTYRQAVQTAALSPELFRDLWTTHPEASEDAIKTYLILRKGFSEPGARLAASAYKDTLALAELNGSGYSKEVRSERDSAPEPPTTAIDMRPRPRTMVEAQRAAGQESVLPAEVRQDVFSLSEGTVRIEWPASLSPESLEDLSDWLDIVKRKIGRSAKAAEPAKDRDKS